MLGDFLDTLMQRGLRALKSAHVDYVLLGGLAMIISGRDRNTRDMDVLVAELPESLTRACLQEGFRHDPSRDRLALPGTILHRYWMELEDTGMLLSFDVQQGQMPFHASVMQRHRLVDLGGVTVSVASPEDLILLKLLAFRPVDRADCLNLVRLYPDLDLGYLLSWVNRLGLQERWAEASSFDSR